MAIQDEVNLFFEKEIEQLKNDTPEIRDWKDYRVFAFICQKYYFFMDPSQSNSDDEIISTITDGPNDGSIDAITVDTSSDDNEIVISQIKYRNSIDLTETKGEIHEMFSTYHDLQNRKYEKYSDLLKQQFVSCYDKSFPHPRVAYFTSVCPTKKTRKKLEDMIKEEFQGISENIIMFYGDDIKTYIEGCKEQKAYVEHGSLQIDNKDNYLEYENAVVVNISANSLKDLYAHMQRSLLGMNLRFYIKNKKVDEGLKTTIKKHPDKFWYLNNGLVIACDNYRFDGNLIKFEKFSIINGGQTTDMIQKIDFDKDFYIVCKVVKLDMDGQSNPNSALTAAEIAEASNSQKPIKPKDLVSNRPEQRDLKGRLRKVKVQYILKNETIEKEFKDKNRHTSVDAIGKIAMAGVLQLPWSRNSSDDLYKEDNGYYSHIYKNTNAQILADLLRVDNAFKAYMNSNEAKTTPNPILTRNSRTYNLAAITLLSLFVQEKDNAIDLADIETKDDKRENIVKAIENLPTLFPVKKDNEIELLYALFGILSTDIINECFENEKETNPELDESNYLKKKDSYFKMMKRINSQFHRSGGTDLRKAANKLFLSEK